jgi:hypothetical protein
VINLQILKSILKYEQVLKRKMDNMKKADTRLQTLLNIYLGIRPGSEGQLANNLLVSIPTVKRWSRGKNLPHKEIAKRVMEFLEREVMEDIKETILSYLDEHKFIAGESVRDLGGHISRNGLRDTTDEQLGRALTELAQEGKIALTIEKKQFLHLHLTAAYAGF